MTPGVRRQNNETEEDKGGKQAGDRHPAFVVHGCLREAGVPGARDLDSG